MKENLMIDDIAEKCYVDTGSSQTNYFDYYKFVELIVKECVEVVKEGINNADDWDSSYWDRVCENRAIAIQKHFGVI